MKTAILLVLFTCLIYFINTQDCTNKYTKDCPPTTTPAWPNKFQEAFEETFTYPIIGSHKTKGNFFYDWTNKRYRVDRENGQYDRYCGPIFPFRNTPCSQIVSEGVRYIYFPDKDYCCNCCSSKHGCGILKPDWMESATFVDYVTEEDGVIYEKWDKKGLQSNFYFASAKDRTLRRIIQEPNDIQDFDTSSFRPEISDVSVFNLPQKCRKDFMCPLLSTCTAARMFADNLAFLQ